MQITPETFDANAEQAEYWSSASGRKWVKFQVALDTVFQAVNDRLLQRAAPAPGDRVLDIGCGTGALALDCASHVGDTGFVVGVDISGPLLDKANERRKRARIAHVDYELADVQTRRFEPQSFDMLISRFGVMFFSDPVAAFKNLKAALRPGGRLSIVAWSSMDDNPWFEIPRDAAVARLGKPPLAPPTAPGPLAFQDVDYVLRLLREAGWSEVTADVETVPLRHPGGVAGVAHLTSNIGPSARIIREFDGGPDDIAEIARHTADGFQQFATADGVRIPARLNFFAAVNG